MNVLLVTVDSLRADRINAEVMPHTRSFADDALEFTECIANGPSTPASFPAIHASRYFASIEGLGLPPADEDDRIQTLAERLREVGYATAGYTDNHFASGSYNFDRGFDVMYDASGKTEGGRLKQFVQSNLDKDGMVFKIIESVYNRVDAMVASATGQKSEYERAESLNRRALKWIDDQDEDWFTWLHYMDPHHPYEAPDEYQRQFLDDPLPTSKCRGLSRKGTHHPDEVTDREWESIRGLYNAECAYVDDQFDALLTALRDRNLLDDTLIIFTADHGELVGEHGHAGHPPEFWEGILKVPLIISWPGREPTRVDGQVRLIDVAPTVADVINLEPFKQWEGKSMRAVANDDIEARKYAFGDVGRQIEYSRCCVRRADGWKLMRHGEDGEFCFNVRDFPDEKPEDDCSSSHPTEYSGLSEVLNNHQNQMERRRRDGSLGVAEEETMVEDHLRDLGYLE
jgi:arylsulfatase A-like enzyme